MLAMLGGLSGFFNSRMDASSTSINPAATAVVRTNNNKAVSFKSQSPSEDKTTIRLYGGLPCETDHMYANYPSEGKRELVDEVSHLKAMVLFHLDLIQQQSECNAAKDKQLAALKVENEMLRQRLERMERRVQLQNSKQKSELSEESIPGGKAAEQPTPQMASNHVDTFSPSRVPANTDQVPEPPLTTIGVSEAEAPAPRKRIKTLLPVRTKPTPSPTSKRKSTKITPIIPEASIKTEDDIIDDLIDQAVKEGAIISVPEATIVPSAVETDKSTSAEEPSCSPSDASSFSILAEHRRIQQQLSQKPAPREPAHLKKESMLTTDEPYSTHVGEGFSQLESLNNDGYVEVPQWVIKPLSGRSSAQGVENLDDEVFTKRHMKHEIDEKRRKRWDLQRIREQRQYEKLRARYEGEDRSLDRVRTRAPTCRSSSTALSSGQDVGSNSAAASAVVVTSLWAGPEDVTHVQIEPWIPVTVFGAPLPNVAQTDFQLPWSNSRSMELLHQSRNAAETVSAKRRQRRSFKSD